MATATLRRVGGSVVMAIPRPILELADLQIGTQVSIDVRDGQLIIAPRKKPRYTLAELLAQCDFSQPLSDEEREWLDAPPVGNEFGAGHE